MDWHMPAGESNVCCDEIAGLQYPPCELAHQDFYRLKAKLWGFVTWSINFFRSWKNSIRQKNDFTLISTLQIFDNHFYLRILYYLKISVWNFYNYNMKHHRKTLDILNWKFSKCYSSFRNFFMKNLKSGVDRENFVIITQFLKNWKKLFDEIASSQKLAFKL